MPVSAKETPLLPAADSLPAKTPRRQPPRPLNGARTGEVDADALYDYVTQTFPLTIAHLAE